ncbi:MAG: type II secretion system protein GspG [Planctomycetaceae bacterium]|jgi:hypothetical protein|nr:type II secretion system protein GspG [Planctomycetaceae bacterium]
MLDYFGMCVRKPNFVFYRHHAESMLGILLPEVQANREFARDLSVRISERIGRGDIDGAWHDVMSMKHIACHYKNEPIFVTNIVGIRIDEMACRSAKLILTHAHPTEEQLAGFVRDLENLPRVIPFSLALTFGRFSTYELLLRFHRMEKIFTQEEWDRIFWKEIPLSRSLAFLPIDRNIAGKRLTELDQELYGGTGMEISEESGQHVFGNPVLRRQYAERIVKKGNEIRHRLNSRSQWYRLPLIRTRSQWLAEGVFLFMIPATESVFRAFDRSDSLNEMLRIALALERYKLANEKYPESLDVLVPVFLEMVPLDPCTGRTTLVYKPVPHGDSPYTLYSLGPNGKDDNAQDWDGNTATSVNLSLNHDIVF